MRDLKDWDQRAVAASLVKKLLLKNDLLSLRVLTPIDLRLIVDEELEGDTYDGRVADAVTESLEYMATGNCDQLNKTNQG